MAFNVEYGFSNSSPHAEKQLSSLEEYLDPITTECLARIGAPQRGTRCLELGPGKGSLLGLLRERVGKQGQVFAVDRDPSHLAPAANLEIVRHDLQQGLPLGGPFSLVHARLLLVHLPNRRQLVKQAAGALSPGGWLVIGEFRFDEPLTVLATGRYGNADLFTRVVETTKDLLVRDNGVELAWALYVQATMGAAGLLRIRTAEHPGMWRGGEAGCGLLTACATQKHQQLFAEGFTEADLRTFHEMMSDPEFRCRSWPFVYAFGQKPPASPTIWVP